MRSHQVQSMATHKFTTYDITQTTKYGKMSLATHKIALTTKQQ